MKYFVTHVWEMSFIHKLYLPSAPPRRRRASGGLLDAGEDYQKTLAEEVAKLQRLYGGGDLESFPEFSFPGESTHDSDDLVQIRLDQTRSDWISDLCFRASAGRRLTEVKEDEDRLNCLLFFEGIVCLKLQEKILEVLDSGGEGCSVLGGGLLSLNKENKDQLVSTSLLKLLLFIDLFDRDNMQKH